MRSHFFVCFNKYGFRLFTKTTWHCWAFAHKHCTFNGFVESYGPRRGSWRRCSLLFENKNNNKIKKYTFSNKRNLWWNKNIRLADLADASKFIIGAFRSYIISGKLSPPLPEGDNSRKIGWGCAARFVKPLPLFQTKICDFPCFISDLIKNLTPYFRADP